MALSKEEAMALDLSDVSTQELCSWANDVRVSCCGHKFDMCTIINARSGRCSENCKYCAQSAHYKTEIEEYPLLSEEAILKHARYNEERGVLRYSLVTAGRRLTDVDVDVLAARYEMLGRETGLSLCASHGLITYEQCLRLRKAGVTRYHNNLETSRRYFPEVCTTHTYDDKLQTIRWAQEAGMEVCSGGIMGMGETREDRLDMLADLAALGIKSVPINFLMPIPGTPYESMSIMSSDEMLRIIALARFMLPQAVIRLAAGRAVMGDCGRQAFLSGANGAISGDMLTTTGTSIREDRDMLESMGYDISL